MAPHHTVSDDRLLSGPQSLENRGTDSTLSVTNVTPDFAPNLALPWVLRLRYGMVVGEAAIILGMSYGLRLEIPLLWTLTPLAVVLASNILLGRLRVLTLRFPQETLGAAFCLDTLCLTAMLALTGGPMNPFSLLYLVQITLSAVVLRKVWTWVLGVLSTVCFGLLFFFRAPSDAFQSHHVEQGLSPHLVGMWIAFVIAVGLITFFTGKIADALRTREHAIQAVSTWQFQAPLVNGRPTEVPTTVRIAFRLGREEGLPAPRHK